MARPEEKSFTTGRGETFTFLFNVPGMIAAEKEADEPFHVLVKGATKRRIGHLLALIKGGLATHHPELTLEDCNQLMEDDGTALGAALWPALASAMPDRKAGTENPPKARATAKSRGTGGRSSPRGSKKD